MGMVVVLDTALLVDTDILTEAMVVTAVLNLEAMAVTVATSSEAMVGLEVTDTEVMEATEVAMATLIPIIPQTKMNTSQKLEFLKSFFNHVFYSAISNIHIRRL